MSFGNTGVFGGDARGGGGIRQAELPDRVIYGTLRADGMGEAVLVSISPHSCVHLAATIRAPKLGSYEKQGGVGAGGDQWQKEEAFL
jgi:hypothetical protein